MEVLVRARRPLIALTAALLAAVAAVGQTPLSATGQEPQPVLISGTIPERITAVTVHAVVASADAEGDFTTSEIPDPEVTVDGESFVVRIDPAAIPSEYVQPGGVVDLDVQVKGATKTWLTHTSARGIISGDDAFWTDPVSSSAEVSSGDYDRAARRGEFPRQRTASIAAVDEEHNEPELEDDGVVGKDYVPVAEEPTTAVYCIWREVDGSSRTRSVTIGTTYTVGDHEAFMKVSSWVGAHYGIGVGTGDGAFEQGGTKWLKSGWEKEWLPYNGYRSYRTNVEYRKYDHLCRGGPGVYPDEWRPYKETGGVGHNNGIDRPDWGNCRTVDAGPWSRYAENGHAYSYGSAVKFKEIIGTDLSIKREYSSGTRVTYSVVNNRTKLCGNNDWPSHAGKIMQKWR